MTRRRIIFAVLLFLLLTVLSNKIVFPYQHGNLVPSPTVSTVPSQVLSAEGEESTVLIGEKAIVARVIDGDTIKLLDGRIVRYIGIDTPEIKDPKKPKECLGNEAYLRNKVLVEGKEVVLEKDVSEKDRFRRLLRYVWVDDVLINELLVKEGLARSSRYPPDIKYQDRLESAQEEAKLKFLGLWAEICEKVP